MNTFLSFTDFIEVGSTNNYYFDSTSQYFDSNNQYLDSTSCYYFVTNYYYFDFTNYYNFDSTNCWVECIIINMVDFIEISLMINYFSQIDFIKNSYHKKENDHLIQRAIIA